MTDKAKGRAFDFNWTMARVGRMLFHPRSEWQLIKDERDTVPDVFIKYLCPALLLLPIGYLALGYACGREILSVKMLVPALAGYGAALLFQYGAAGETQGLLPKYGGRCSKEEACQLVAYAFTPLYFSGFLLVVQETRIAVAGLALWGMTNLGIGIARLTGLEGAKMRELLLYLLCRFTLLGALIVIALTLCIYMLSVLFNYSLHIS